MTYPMEHGVVKDWESMEHIYEHIFESLKCNPKVHPILITEPPNNPITNRVKLAEKFFEKFDVPQLFFHTQPVLSLYSRGLITGVVLDVGDGCTHASAICEGFSISNATQRMELGGRDVTNHLMKLLQKDGQSFKSNDFQIVRQIKESLCYVESEGSKFF